MDSPAKTERFTPDVGPASNVQSKKDAISLDYNIVAGR